MGLRFSFGLGPLRASLPLTPRRRRRRRYPAAARAAQVQPARPSGRSNGKAWAWVIGIVALFAVVAAIAGNTPSHSPGPTKPVSVVSTTTPTPAASTPTPTPTPTPAKKPVTHHHHPAPAPTHTQVAAPPPPPASSCYPLTDSGHCYEPGEYCRYSDAGTTGIAGDGERIKCENNNGLRWEPY